MLSIRLRRRILVALFLSVGAVGTLAFPLRAGADSPAGPHWQKATPLPGLGTGRIWSVAASPAAAGVFLAGTDNGVYTTADSGQHWSLLGLSGVRVWAVGWDNTAAHAAYAATNGHGLQRWASNSWTDVSTGFRSRDVRCLAFGLQAMVAGTAAGVEISSNGVSWRPAGLDSYAVSAITVAANSPQFTVIAGVDSGDVSRGFLFRSQGGDGNWEVLEAGLPSSATVTGLASGPLGQAATQRPLEATTSQASQGAFHSIDGGTTWSASSGVPEPLILTTATFSPLDPNLVYAGADSGGSSGGGLFRSTDSGATFSAANAGLPVNNQQVESIAVSAITPPQLVAALDPPSGGVIYTETDTSAPAPPALAQESPGAPIPSSLPTPKPTPFPVLNSAPPQPSQGGESWFGRVFSWPVPLVFWILALVGGVYFYLRWRQRYDVEGPP